VKRYFYLQKLFGIAAILLGLSCFPCVAELMQSADTIRTTVSVDSSYSSEKKTVGIDPANQEKVPYAGNSYIKSVNSSAMVHKNPGTTVLFSALVPGGGQLYTGNYIKSGLFFASEGVFGLISLYRYNLLKDYRNASTDLSNQLIRFKNKDSIIVKKTNLSNSSDSARFDTTFMSVHVQLNYNYSKFQERENRVLFYQSALWMACLYYWNIVDALKNTGYFHNDKPKDPSTAGWLSAIPFLGLGQIYNGELSKAGMILTAQLNMGYMIFNYNSLVQTSEDNIRALSASNSREGKDPDAVDLLSKWHSKHDEAFRNRNTWAWYAIAMYLYGILDAVVDAHLHDAATKMKLEPDLQLDKSSVGMHMKVDF